MQLSIDNHSSAGLQVDQHEGDTTITLVPLKHVTLALDTLHPETWTRHEVRDVCAFLKQQFGERFPDTARIYHEHLAQGYDVTPADEDGIARLQELPGPFHVMVYPAGEFVIPLIISLVIGVASFLLAPSPSAAPVIAQRNTTAVSPNNELSERSNRARPNARIPDIYGTVLSTPDLIAAPYKIFENGREVEYSLMCIGRGPYEVSQLASGHYNIRDAETLVAQIPGTSVAVYAPYTSPNSGDDPQLLIGSSITHKVVTSVRSNSVNGQVLRPPNAVTMPPENDIRFRWPNIIELSEASSRTFTGFFVEGDEITVAGAAVTGGDDGYSIYNAGVQLSYAYLGADRFNIVVSGPINPNLSIGGDITITDYTASYPIDWSGLEKTLDLSGTYEIDDIIYVSHDTDTLETTITIVLVNPAAVNSDWSGLSAFGSANLIKMFDIATDVDEPGYDLDGDYTVLSVTEKQIIVDDPESVAVDWAVLETYSPTPLLDVTISTAEASKWVGPFVLDSEDMELVYSNFVAPNGLYRDDGTDQFALTIGVEIELTPIDPDDTPSGPAQYFNMVLSGSASLKETVAVTLSARPTQFTGRCKVRARRITEHDSVSAGQVVDEIRWRDVYEISPVDQLHFGNVTIIHAVTYATASALAVKERKLNLEVTRKIPVLDSFGNFTTSLSASNDSADIFCALCLDRYIGGRNYAELDIDNIYDTAAAAETYFGTPVVRQFNYTFDSDNMSFEEMAQAVANAMFCVAYRRGNVIKLSLERETDDSTLLFNHRNKLPGTETRTVRFGRLNDNDGVEYTYVDPDDDSLITVYLPENYPSVNPKKVESIGVRDHLHAYFHIHRLWNRIIYQNTATEFEATHEADLLIRNDRILATDGTRPYSQEGEVIGIDSLELTLSQNVDLTDHPSYVIFLQHVDGVTDSYDITAGSEPNQVVLSGAPRLPLVTDPDKYARTTYVIVGENDTTERAFLVSERDPGERMTSTVRAINYDARYYQNDTDYINELVDENGYGPGGGYEPAEDGDTGYIPPPVEPVSVAYLEGSKDTFSPTASTAMSGMMLNNSNIEPDVEPAPDAVLMITVAMWTTTTSGVTAPDRVYIVDDNAVEYEASLVHAIGGNGGLTGGRNHLVLAMVRIPGEGIPIPELCIDWPTLNSGTSTVRVSTNVMYNVNDESLDFVTAWNGSYTSDTGTYSGDDIDTQNEASVGERGAIFAANIQFTGGDFDALIATYPENVEFTMQTPDVSTGASHYYMTGYLLLPDGIEDTGVYVDFAAAGNVSGVRPILAVGLSPP